MSAVEQVERLLRRAGMEQAVSVFDIDQIKDDFARTVAQADRSDARVVSVFFSEKNHTFSHMEGSFDEYMIYTKDADGTSVEIVVDPASVVRRMSTAVVWQSASGQWYRVRFCEFFPKPEQVDTPVNYDMSGVSSIVFTLLLRAPLHGHVQAIMHKIGEKEALKTHARHEQVCGYADCTRVYCAWKCAGCEDTRYCSPEHQKLDWRARHKRACRNPALRAQHTRRKHLRLQSRPCDDLGTTTNK